jgi:hypothetical protein
MDEATVSSNHSALSELLSDATIVRLVTVLNTTSQSILEILEYGFTPKEISRAMAKGVVEFNKPVGENRTTKTIEYGLEMGDYYQELIREKIRLARMGLLILEIMESDLKQATEFQSNFAASPHERDTLVNSTSIQH